MPRKTINFQNTIIYKIVCKDLQVTQCYVGHTTNFINRKNHHKSACSGVSNNKNCKLYIIINENGGWENWDMIEIEKFPCLDLNEARSKERFWYENLNADMNDRSPYKRLLDNSTRAKEWREKNKEKVISYNKQYKDEHKDEIKEKQKQYHKKYREENRDKLNKKASEYRALKKQQSSKEDV